MKMILPLWLALTLGPFAVPAQTNPPIRLALIAPDAELRPALDLLTVEYSHREGIVLLERAEIERVLREQSLATTGKDDLKLGQLLGADGLLIAGLLGDGAAAELGVRLVAVKPGVVLGAVRTPWPVANLVEWAGGLPKHLAPLLPKLGVLAKDAVPISVVNLRAAVASRETRELEEQLTRLTIERLTRERELFVLERRQMELLSAEKELPGGEEAAFWNGSYLLDGVIDRDGYTAEQATLHARLVPPQGGSPLKLAVAGPRTNVAGLVELLTVMVLDSLQRSRSLAVAWSPAAEAQRYFEEAKWAMRWSIFPQAQAAIESAWALGMQRPETAELRVRAWRQSGFHQAGCHIIRQNGWITFTEPPDTSRFEVALHAAELFRSSWIRFQAGEAKLDRRWLELGCEVMDDLSNWLRHYYFTVEARVGMEAKITAARQLARELFTQLAAHPDLASTRLQAHLFSTAAHVAAFWAETPEEGLDFHRQTLAAGHWPLVRQRFLYVGRFPNENYSSSGAIGASRFADSASPPLAGWIWEDRQRWPALWHEFVNELCAATNPLQRVEGFYLRCAFAWSGEAFERALGELLAYAQEQFGAIYRAGLHTNLLTDLRVLAGASEPAGGGMIELRKNQLSPKRQERIVEQLWKPFEAEFKEFVHAGDRRTEFEAIKAYFQPERGFDLSSLGAYVSRNYDTNQARELLPIVKAYEARITEGMEQSPDVRTRMRARNVRTQVGWLIAKLEAQVSPPVVPSPSAVAAAPARSVAGGPGGLNPPPARLTTNADLASRPLSGTEKQLRVDRFWLAKAAGLEMRNPVDISLTDACWREGRLWVQLVYTEYSPGTLRRHDYCQLAVIDPNSFQTEFISLRDQIPSYEGSFFRVPIQQRMFEVLNNHVFVSAGDGLKRYSLRDRRWEALALPVTGPVRLQRLGDRLFVSTADSILEVKPDGSGMTVLASSRRQPPVTALDAVDGYGLAGLFSLRGTDLKTFVRGKVYSLDPGETDWRVAGENPPGTWLLPLMVEDGLFLQRTDPIARGELWGMYDGRDSLELLFGPPPPPPMDALQRFRLQNTSTNRPKWSAVLGPATLGNTPGTDGRNLWIFSGQLQIAIRDGRAAVVEENGSHGLLLRFTPGVQEPLRISLELDIPPDALSAAALRGADGLGNPRERLFRVTPEGLVLTRPGLLGFWFIPQVQLEQRTEKL